LEHYNGDEKKALIAKAKTYLQPFFDWFGDWTDPEATNVSKVVDENGEPLVVWHGDDYNSFEEGDRSKAAMPYVTYFANRKYQADYNKYYAVFLNIKKPLFEHADFTEDAIQDYEFFYKNVLQKGFDGVVGLNDETENHSFYSKNAREFVTVSPNQAKSIDNQGTFSTIDNNIYYKIESYDDLLQQVKENREALLEDIGEFNNSNDLINYLLQLEGVPEYLKALLITLNGKSI
jgi:hypothetical protein